MNANNPLRPQARFENLVVQELSNELLVYNLETNKAFNLNQTSTLVWQNCDGTKDINQIAKALEAKLKKNVPDELVWLALDSLKKEGLVTYSEPNGAKGINRREVIRRVGLATIVALPVVSSLIAPTAANAQSVTADVCNSCSKKNDPCNNGCENELGFCFDNSGCGCGQQVIAGVTCAQCKTGVPFAGGVGTGSWKLTINCP